MVRHGRQSIGRGQDFYYFCVCETGLFFEFSQGGGLFCFSRHYCSRGQVAEHDLGVGRRLKYLGKQYGCVVFVQCQTYDSVYVFSDCLSIQAFGVIFCAGEGDHLFCVDFAVEFVFQFVDAYMTAPVLLLCRLDCHFFSSFLVSLFCSGLFAFRILLCVEAGPGSIGPGR